MKTILKYLSFLTLCLAIVSCEKDKKEINLNLKPVSNLQGPENNQSFDLGVGTTIKFEWQSTQAEDGGLVLYEVLFDQESGDFSKPVYSILSDGKGVQNTLSLTNVQLDHIADLAGAAPLSRIKLKWTVSASKGWNILLATESRTIEVTRGITLPQTLKLTGSATEGVSSPIEMKKLADGIFETFTKVSSGNVEFVDENNSTYGIQLGAAGWQIVGGSTPSGLTGDKVLWVKLNFGNQSAQVFEISKMTLWYCNGNKDAFELPYVGNGVWRKDNVEDFLTPAGWTNREERYKYRMVINDGTGETYQWINSFFGDPAGQDGQYPSSLDYRSVNLEANNGSQWDWGWKIDRNYFTQGSIGSFWVTLNTSEGKYNQNYQKD